MTEQQLDKILVVDDDARLRSLLQRFLEEAGYAVKAVGDAEQMDRALSREIYSLMVLDLMLPGEDGLSICRRLREAENRMPIIMLTAKGDDAERIEGLDAGADDYLPNRSIPGSWMRAYGQCCAAMCVNCPARPARKKVRCVLAPGSWIWAIARCCGMVIPRT